MKGCRGDRRCGFSCTDDIIDVDCPVHNPQPADPVSPLMAGAQGAHELFLTLKGAGFTRAEALFILGVMLASAQADS